METLIFYFLKVFVLLSLFYLSYHLLLKKETFFVKNRLFLLLGLITSLILPLLTVTKTVWIDPSPTIVPESLVLSDFYNDLMPSNINTEVQQIEINWNYIGAGIYVLGILFFLIKFVLSSLSLYNILHQSPIQKQNGFRFIDSENVTTPFSFFNYIAFDSSAFSREELQNIITHEKIHCTQKHSFDIILSELFSIVFWLNPLVWLYKKAIQQNLEFIADSQAVKTSENKINYQKTLLKITINPKNLALANPFFQPLIKKRIIMLNKKQSKKVNIIKYTFVLPVLVVFVMQFQTKVVAQEKENTSKEVFYQGNQGEATMIRADMFVWVKDLTKNPNEYMNQSTGDRVTVKSNSWEDVKLILENNTSETMEKDSIREKFILQTGSWEEAEDVLKNKELISKRMGENPLVILNGKEARKKDVVSFETTGTITYYDKKSAVKKFGNKAKDGAIIIEGKIINLDDNKNPLKENEERLKQREAQLRERERQARERSGLSGEELKERAQNIRQRAEKRQQVSAEIRKERKERRESERQGQINSRLPDQNEERIKERQQALEKRKSELEVRKKEMEEKRNELKDLYRKAAFSVVINKNTTDREIKESIAQFKSNQNIEMKVSNIKRNKNGEIYRIKISLVESSETSNNKKESKAESTFERNSNDAIPE